MSLHVLTHYLSLNRVLYGSACLVLVNYLIKTVNRLIRLPPGPWGLPMVGYLPFIRKDTHLHFSELSEKYGSVFSLKVGVYDVVIVNGWPAIKEAIAADGLLARPDEDFFTIINDVSFIEMSGDEWKGQRRVALTTLRNVGLGKSTMEDAIREEVDCFVKELATKQGTPINFESMAALSVPNNIAILLFGHKFDYRDPRKIKLDADLKIIDIESSFFNLVLFIPWLTKILISSRIFPLKEARAVFERIDQFMGNKIKEHQERNDSDIVDYIDGYLEEMKKRSDDKDHRFNLTTLRRNTTSFYGAGSTTIRQTLNWMVHLLVAYPEYQDQIREEVKQNIGFDRLPESLDRQSMPFTMSFIYEVHRFSSLVPINLPRRASRDVTIDGKLIPRDTLVFFNFWSVHRDVNLFPNPDKFDPTRFLNEDRSKAIKPPYLLAFSGGKRICPGESFANLQLFLYLICILQKFQLSSKPGADVSLEANYSVTRTPKYPVDIILEEIK